MIFGTNFRRQAHVCLRLAETCDDQHLAERLTAMAADLFSKADETEERPNENAGESAHCM
jgi:predicted regulator of Ras-like GTPase activity (Roadblock/LC7/MglB family)